MIIVKVIFFISLFIIFWAMIGYPISLKLISKLVKKKEIVKDYKYEPKVTIMIVAHNEEKVILKKLENSISLDYPKEKLEILVASDNSTDRTNEIVEEFINNHSDFKVRLYKSKERKGKTNAQNEAQKTVRSEILVMTDANSIFKKNAIRELVCSFTSEDIAYVCGKLIYANSEEKVGKSESSYWNIDLQMRETESEIQTITAGNGAIYACRNSEYKDFRPIQCHDSAIPVYYALQSKRAIFNKDAIAYEKAGGTIQDEFKRKVRMNRLILSAILPDIRILNIFKYKWFSYFYFGHRTCRYLLWLSHILLFITNIILIKYSWFYILTFIVQILIYVMILIGHALKIKNKIFNMTYYYCMTVLAQIIGVKNIITGKAKPFWEKAETTR